MSYQIGIAVSADGQNWFIRTEPAISKGLEGAWDAHETKWPHLEIKNEVIYCFYSARSSNNSPWSIGLARSYNKGITFEKYGSEPVLVASQPWENGQVHDSVVLYDKDEPDLDRKWKMWYGGGATGSAIGFAYSKDGLSWIKYARNPVISLGPIGSWDDNVIIPNSIFKLKEKYILFYTGRQGEYNRSGGAGYVTFTDPIGIYTKNPDNPVRLGDNKQTTANVVAGSNIVFLGDASMFPDGSPVWITDNQDHFLTNVEKRISNSAVQIAIISPVDITDNGYMTSVINGETNISSALYNDRDGWKFFITGHMPLGQSPVWELTVTGFADKDLHQIHIDYTKGLMIPVSFTDGIQTTVSRENPSVIELR